MKSSAILWIRVLIIASLLLQFTGSLSLNEAASIPAERAGQTPAMRGQDAFLSFFTAGVASAQSIAQDEQPPPGLPAVEELAPPEPLPSQPVLDEPPPPLEPGEPYYATPLVDSTYNVVQTDVGGTIITDTVWTLAGSPYVATSNVNVAAGITLTIEPGVVLNANQGVSLNILGRLLAQGTAGAPITFAGTSAVPGWWGGVRFEGTGLNPLSGSVLDYVAITDGGYYASRPGNLYVYYADVSLDHGQVSNGKYSGIYGSTQGVVHVNHTTLSGNGLSSLNPEYAIQFSDGSVAPNLANLTLIGNSQDAIAFGQGTLTTRTWHSLGYPYILTGNQTVPAGATLTVEAGVQARFFQGASLMVHGQILAQGTPQAGIHFSGTTAAPGWWGGLYLEGVSASPLSGSALEHVTIEDGGHYSSRPANLYVYYAQVSLDNSLISDGLYNGVYGGTGGVAHIHNTTISNNGTSSPNQDFAIWFADGSMSPDLAGLTLSGNSQDAIAFGQGTLTTRTWRALGYPYHLTGSQTIPAGQALTVEPGVTVIADSNYIISVAGRMEAVGGPTEPITFTASSPVPGSWQGLYFNGQASRPAIGVLDYTTIQYGGGCSSCANLRTYHAQVNIGHSKIENSSTDGVLASTNSAARLVINNSQITGNASYGVRNADATGFVMASNNWWGHASGPATPTNTCNLNGIGQPVTDRVAFLPYLTGSDQDPENIELSSVLTLSLNPLRYYAPADNTTRVWFEITLRDGTGKPISGQIVKLRSSLGAAYDGGATDAAGKVFAYLLSNKAGEAVVYAELDQQTACDFLRSSTTEISFTAPGNDPLSPDAKSPYANDRVEFEPQPVVAGVPGVLRVRLTNPNDFPIRVDATFGFAQLGLGLTFGPVGEVLDFMIPAKSTEALELPWTPLVSGKFCIRVDYTWESANTSAAEGAGYAERISSSSSTQSNTMGRPGSLLPVYGKPAIDQANIATTSLGDITFAAAGLDDIASVGMPAASAPVGFLQNLMVGNILDFIYEGGSVSNCALRGGANCGGWKGPRMKYPGESLGNLRKDPPSPDYDTLVPLELLTVPDLMPGQGIPAGRATAINELVRAGLDMTSYLVAAAATFDRYAGAVEAESWGDATMQANAFDYYLKQSAFQMLQVADKMDGLVAELNSEGLKFLLAENDFIAYQQRLATQGFNAQEIQAAHMVGKDDEGIALSLQRRLALDPKAVSGWFDDRLTKAAQAYRDLSFALTYQPPFGAVGGGQAGRASATAGEMDSLVRTSQTEFSFEVGNPYPVDTTIDLRVRRVDLPADWIIILSSDSVTLAPGAQTTVTARAIPGRPGVQNTLPRFAVEGLANGVLLGGVEFAVYLPEYQGFSGADRLFLPVLMSKP